MDEAFRLSKFPIWNETTPLGDPEIPIVVPARVVVEPGQNQAEFALVQLGMLAEGKKSPFDPVSMKLL